MDEDKQRYSASHKESVDHEMQIMQSFSVLSWRSHMEESYWNYGLVY